MAVTNSKTFDVTNPSRRVTDPKGHGDVMRGAGVPAHLYKLAEKESPTTIIVAWKGLTPVYNEMVEVKTREALQSRVADGWSDTGPIVPSDDAEAPVVPRRRSA